MNRIYIIGPVASGKSTLARELSKILNIPCYELDNVVYEKKNTKRSVEEITKIFNNIIKKKKWIIEDVGREIFKDGVQKADIVYFFKYPKIKIYYRIIKRWLKQKMGLEECNFIPGFKDLINMFKWAEKDYRRYKENSIPKDKLVIIKNSKDLKKIKKEKY